MSKDSENKVGKTYLKTLAQEHQIHFDTYIAIMAQYKAFLSLKYHIDLEKLKGKPLMPWQADLLRRLNPTDFQIATIKEFQEYDAWHEWMSSVLTICQSMK